MSLGDTTTDVTIVDAGGGGNSGSYVDWGAIIAGAVLATAITFVLVTFGSALGLSMTSPYEGESTSLWGIAIAAGLWLLWVQICSFGAGAYLTGRLRRRAYDASEHESDIRDASHGLLVWALGTLLGAVIAFMSISGAATTAANAVSNVAGGAASAVGSAAQGAANAADNPAVAGYVDRLFRGTNGEPIAP
ncbi:MAG TPA: hypothetical protein VGN98_11825, partial [Tianweitania sediminis]|nr:hypothetical protein [Tianweitania sediminis]